MFAKALKSPSLVLTHRVLLISPASLFFDDQNVQKLSSERQNVQKLVNRPKSLSCHNHTYLYIRTIRTKPFKTLAKSVQIYAPTLPYFVKYESLTLSGSEESEWMVEILPGRLNTTEDFKLNSKVDLICVLV